MQDREGVTAVIVTYNAEGFIEEHLRSVLASPEIRRSIYIDNNSTDETRAYLRTVAKDSDAIDLIESETNAGFSRSSNLGLGLVETPYVLFLNPDVILNDRSAVVNCIEVLETESDVGVIGCALYMTDGRFDHACKRGEPTFLRALFYLTGLAKRYPSNRILGGYVQSHIEPSRSADVEALNGAFMLMRAELAKSLGGFDEDFWMYGEDLDLCRRIRKAEFRVRYLGSVRAIHIKGASDGGVKSPVARRAFVASMLVYRRKHGTWLERSAPSSLWSVLNRWVPLMASNLVKSRT